MRRRVLLALPEPRPRPGRDRDAASSERDAAVRRADEAATAAAARDGADAKAWEIYQLLEAGKRDRGRRSWSSSASAALEAPSARCSRRAGTRRGHAGRSRRSKARPRRSRRAGRPRSSRRSRPRSCSSRRGRARALMHYYLGVAASKASQLDNAIAHLQAAVDGDVDLEDARFHLASVLDRAGSAGKRRPRYDRFATAHPHVVVARFATRRGGALLAHACSGRANAAPAAATAAGLVPPARRRRAANGSPRSAARCARPKPAGRSRRRPGEGRRRAQPEAPPASATPATDEARRRERRSGAATARPARNVTALLAPPAAPFTAAILPRRPPSAHAWRTSRGATIRDARGAPSSRISRSITSRWRRRRRAASSWSRPRSRRAPSSCFAGSGQLGFPIRPDAKLVDDYDGVRRSHRWRRQLVGVQLPRDRRHRRCSRSTRSVARSTSTPSRTRGAHPIASSPKPARRSPIARNVRPGMIVRPGPGGRDPRRARLGVGRRLAPRVRRPPHRVVAPALTRDHSIAPKRLQRRRRRRAAASSDADRAADQQRRSERRPSSASRSR